MRVCSGSFVEISLFLGFGRGNTGVKVGGGLWKHRVRVRDFEYISFVLKITDLGDSDEEVAATTSFLARNLQISEKVDADGEIMEPRLMAGKILASRWVFVGIWKCVRLWSVKEIKPGLLQKIEIEYCAVDPGL